MNKYITHCKTFRADSELVLELEINNFKEKNELEIISSSITVISESDKYVQGATLPCTFIAIVIFKEYLINVVPKHKEEWL